MRSEAMNKAKLFPCPSEHFWKDMATAERHHDMPGCPGYDTAAYDQAVEELVEAARAVQLRLRGWPSSAGSRRALQDWAHQHLMPAKHLIAAALRAFKEEA